MYFKQFYLGCLAHASYLVGSGGEAAVVDPQRDVDQYVEEADANGLKIKYIIETHLHADFVSGHRELAARTGGTIVFSHRAGARFEHLEVKDGEVLKIGDLSLSILETPGHTPESICVVLSRSRDGDPELIFTGDTLFVGDVGRPDLIGSQGITASEMASMLYDSLYEKILKLPDEVKVYPAHGAGSLCGKNLGKERFSTIGEQKRFNYALKSKNKEDFIDLVCQDQPEVPQYFPRAVAKNREGADHLETIASPKALSPAEVNKLMQAGKTILDVRSSTLFGAGHLPGSLNIGLGGQFASWAGTLIAHDEEVVLVAEDREAVEEAVVRLARAGHEAVAGYLDGGIFSWSKEGLPLHSIEQITVQDLKEILEKGGDLQVLDVRRPQEYSAGHVPGASNIPLASLAERQGEVDRKRLTYVICAGGYRSSAATSILARAGEGKIVNIVGGTGAWKNSGFDLEVEAGHSCVSGKL